MKCNCHNEVSSCVDIVPIFSGLSVQEKKELAEMSVHKTFKKGEFIYQAGDYQDSLYIVHQGSVKNYRISEDGKEQFLRVISPGDFLGELSLFADKHLTDYAEAIENCSLCILNGDIVKKYIETHPSVAMKIIASLSERIEVLEELVEGINLHSVEWRLARVLLKMKDKYNVVYLTTTKGNFASQLGMSQETLSRKLTYFQEQKYIKMITPRKIAIINSKALEMIE